MEEPDGADALTDFKQRLIGLRLSVGNPDNTWLKGFGLSRSTLHELLKGDVVSRWDTVSRYVAACAAFARSDRGIVPDDPIVLDKRYWSQLYGTLPGRPELRPPVDSRRRVRVGLLPRAASRYQPRSAVEGLGAQSNRYHVLSGLGGVGKSQIAARTARRLWNDGAVDLLVWAPAGKRGSVVFAYGTAWERLSGERGDGERAAERFLEWLETTRLPWLVVLDDVIDPDELAGLWPPETGSGRMLVTTRLNDDAMVGDGRRLLRIPSFSAEESAQYLRAKLEDRPELLDGADDLAAALGGLPLALAQAVAYVRGLDKTCAAYLDRLNDRGLSLLRPRSLPDGQRLLVSATWSFSVERADALAPEGIASRLLRLAALLSPDGIPEDFFTSEAVGRWLPPSGRGEGARDALRNLRHLSLVDIDTAGHGRILVHALVQRVTRDEIPDDRLPELRRVCADALAEIWVEGERDRERGALLRANASGLIDGTLFAGGVHPLVFRLGTSMGESGALEAAAEFLARARMTADEVLPADHPDLLALRRDEMYWLGEGGEVESAAALADALVEDCVRALGADHPLTLESRLYHARWIAPSDPEAAISELTVLVNDTAGALGPDHKDTLTVRNDLAHFRGAAGDTEGAVRDFALLAEDRARLLSPSHEHTLITRNDHGHWLRRSGRYAEAVTVLRAVVEDCEAELGSEHRFTLGARGNLIVARRWLDGIDAQREDLRVLCGRLRRVLGPRHPMTVKFEQRLRHWEAGEDLPE